MIVLSKDFTKNGIHYQQIFKNDELFIYRCTNETYGYKYFEVFKRRINKAGMYHNDDWERYPNDNDFGRNWAYACPNAKSVIRTLQDYHPEYQLPMTYADLEKMCR